MLTTTVITLMDALVTAHDCITFDGSLDELNDGIIRKRALDQITSALSWVEHLMPAWRQRKEWEANELAKRPKV